MEIVIQFCLSDKLPQVLQKYILLEDIDGAGHKATHRKFFVLSLYIKTKNHPFPFRLSRLKYFVEVK